MQRKRLLVLALLVELVDLHNGPREHVREGRDAARGADAETPDQEIRLPAEDGEALGRQRAGEPRDLGHGAAGQLHAHDVVVLLGQARDGRRVEVHAVAAPGKLYSTTGSALLAATSPKKPSMTRPSSPSRSTRAAAPARSWRPPRRRR